MPGERLVKSEAAKKQLMRLLGSQGYPTYAWLLEPFNIYLTEDPNVVGYMIPGKATIVLNGGLDIDQVSTVVRHEILHEYLSHGPRSKAFEKSHPDRLFTPDLSNIAADYEISNRGYTDEDKRSMRHLVLGDQVLQGLVTEDQHPGWEDKTFEEMYDELTKEYTKDSKEMQKKLQSLTDLLNKMQPQDIQDLIDQADQQAQGNPPPSGGRNTPPKSGSGSQEDQNSQGEQGAAGDSKPAQELRDQAGEAGKDLKDLKGELSNIQKNQGGPFGDAQDQRDKVDIAERVKEIQRRLTDIGAKQRILDETDTVINKENVKKAKEKEYRNITTGLNKFRMNFQRFVKDQLEYYRGSTWNRPNKNYAGSSLIMPGRTMYAPSSVPSINVYWDVSGSFDDPAKTQGARDAIGTINQYVKRGEVKINVFYFADRVSSTAGDAGGGTDGNAVLNHIEQTKPTNVVVITDSDVDNAGNHHLVTVPGAVWMLFYDREANDFAKVLKGKQETKTYLIEY